MATTRKPSSKTTRTPAATDALALLKRDHAEVKKLFAQFEKTDARQKASLSRQICHELTIHASMEEEAFYPLAKEFGQEITTMVLEGLEEHREVKELIRELDSTRANDERFEPRMKLLQEDIEHHVEEEEGTLFPALKKAVDPKRLQMWAETLQHAKTRIEAESAPGERRVTEQVQDPTHTPTR